MCHYKSITLVFFALYGINMKQLIAEVLEPYPLYIPRRRDMMLPRLAMRNTLLGVIDFVHLRHGATAIRT
jgi:hypothetical protein